MPPQTLWCPRLQSIIPPSRWMSSSISWSSLPSFISLVCLPLASNVSFSCPAPNYHSHPQNLWTTVRTMSEVCNLRNYCAPYLPMLNCSGLVLRRTLGRILALAQEKRNIKKLIMFLFAISVFRIFRYKIF